MCENELLSNAPGKRRLIETSTSKHELVVKKGKEKKSEEARAVVEETRRIAIVNRKSGRSRS